MPSKGPSSRYSKQPGESSSQPILTDQADYLHDNDLTIDRTIERGFGENYDEHDVTNDEDVSTSNVQDSGEKYHSHKFSFKATQIDLKSRRRTELNRTLDDDDPYLESEPSYDRNQFLNETVTRLEQAERSYLGSADP